MRETEYQRLARVAKRAEEAYHQAKGRQQAAVSALTDNFDVNNPKAAKALLATLVDERNELEEELDDALEQFAQTYGDSGLRPDDGSPVEPAGDERGGV